MADKKPDNDNSNVQKPGGSAPPRARNKDGTFRKKSADADKPQK